MTQFEETNDEALTIEKIFRQLLNEHFLTTNNEQQETNNSFIFLEKSSLNLLLAYLLVNSKKDISPLVNEDLASITSEKINQIMQENEQEFNAIIHLLKDVT